MIRPSEPRRILIVRPSALGDVCRTVPVLASLHRAWPEAQTDWVVQDESIDAIAAHPALHEAIAFPRRQFAAWWRSPRVLAELGRWLGEIRRRRYDLVLDCQGLGRSGLITRYSGAPRRVGLRTSREMAWLAYTLRVPAPASPHAVDRMLTLVKALAIEPLPDMRLHVPQSQRQWWAGRRAAAGLDDNSYAVLAPTARWQSKRWPGERFAALAPALLQRGFARIVLIGAPGEEDQVRELVAAGVAATGAVIDLVGRTSVGQTMAIIEGAGLVVANDSAPLHMAVGLDRPCLGLYGPTEPDLVGPYGLPRSALRRYVPQPGRRVYFKDASLGDSLMRLISVEDVLARIDELLGSHGARRPASASSERPS